MDLTMLKEKERAGNIKILFKSPRRLPTTQTNLKK